jgi:C-terminal domain of 1-Cys peroxiredoxin
VLAAQPRFKRKLNVDILSRVPVNAAGSDGRRNTCGSLFAGWYLDSIQLTAKHQVSTPANWKPGDDVIISGSVSDDEARKSIRAAGRHRDPICALLPSRRKKPHAKRQRMTFNQVYLPCLPETPYMIGDGTTGMAAAPTVDVRTGPERHCRNLLNRPLLGHAEPLFAKITRRSESIGQRFVLVLHFTSSRSSIKFLHTCNLIELVYGVLLGIGGGVDG